MNAVGADVVWHDVECGGYSADLQLWEELAAGSPGAVLELGCGSGRMSLHVARRGHTLRGIDVNPDLVEAFNGRAEGLPATATVADARALELGEAFGLVAAPMQFLQLLRSRDERIACLSCAREHLLPGGRVAAALAEPMSVDGAAHAADATSALIPDVQEVDGWIYSSLPLETLIEGSEILVRRLRQVVSPSGELEESLDSVRLAALTAADVEAEARSAKLRTVARSTIPPTDLHVGSTVLLLEADA